MTNTTQLLASGMVQAAGAELDGSVRTIKHCLGQLTDEQIWRRPEPSMNSIGNLILHLCGNVTQWLTVGIGGGVDARNRAQEFAEQDAIPRVVLIQRLESAVADAQAALARNAAEDAVGDSFLAMRRIQGFKVTGLGAIFSSVSHFQGHAQEIVHMTRRYRGDAYEFAFIPTTPEQGAPVE